MPRPTVALNLLDNGGRLQFGQLSTCIQATQMSSLSIFIASVSRTLSTGSVLNASRDRASDAQDESGEPA